MTEAHLNINAKCGSGLYLFSANGALSLEAWGNAPGIMDPKGLSAESAYHERHESRLQRSPTISIHFPAATPQVRHGESVLWRTAIESRFQRWRRGFHESWGVAPGLK
jgi:hypothetical protein